MTQNHKYSCFFLALGSFFFLTGCWSSHEIEDRSFGVAVAFDKGQKTQIENELEETGAGFPERDLVTLTYQFINPLDSAEQNNGDGPTLNSYINLSQTGDSIHQIVREMALRKDRPVFTPHLKVVVISEELLSTLSLQQLLDFFLHDDSLRLSSRLLVSKGKASDALEVTSASDIPAFHLHGITENRHRTTKILPPLSLAKLKGKLQSDSSFLIQNVATANEEVKFAGAAIINGETKKWHGFLNEEDVEGLTWLKGEGEGGVLKTFDEQSGQIVLFEVDVMKSKITSNVDENKISFDVSIKSEGRLSENWVITDNADDNEFLKRLEKAGEKEVERLVKGVLEKMQKEYQVDVADFGEDLRIQHPRIWETVKGDWDRTFSDIPITVDVTLTIVQ
ncbi:Ger(x)C family spore germination protein [Halalkalibacter hemicellulosilyticus]|uniref:Spore germination protein n=1 Tax=Halalkalibacter hemicellulosilyticusJCM 9152 TaxID=1236971 RepID=W4QCF8_9BACI|nr:Ger(x)C family spore germination protein [Halalkalibacter hemicellulosilyticus]GAE29741.1 spore germination protein [Halalkalibacter hemicellulosilyticusJCM 9152]